MLAELALIKSFETTIMEYDTGKEMKKI